MKRTNTLVFMAGFVVALIATACAGNSDFDDEAKAQRFIKERKSRGTFEARAAFAGGEGNEMKLGTFIALLESGVTSVDMCYVPGGSTKQLQAAVGSMKETKLKSFALSDYAGWSPELVGAVLAKSPDLSWLVFDPMYGKEYSVAPSDDLASILKGSNYQRGLQLTSPKIGKEHLEAIASGTSRLEALDLVESLSLKPLDLRALSAVEIGELRLGVNMGTDVASSGIQADDVDGIRKALPKAKSVKWYER